MSVIEEFFNRCHGKADGTFCDTAGGNRKGRSATERVAAAKKSASILGKPAVKAAAVKVKAKPPVKPEPKKLALVKKKLALAVKKSVKPEPEPAKVAAKPEDIQTRMTKLVADRHIFDIYQGRQNGMNDGSPPDGVHASNMSDEHLAAAIAYRGKAYKRINPALREGASLTDADKETVRQMDDAFKHATVTTKDIIVYRGIDQDGANALKGKSFQDNSYVSTTYDKSVVDSFRDGGGAMLRIRIPKGTPVLKLSNDKTGGESEILLPRGGQFKQNSDGTYTFG